ncbi:MAG: PD-(D/E)XK nuclease family protein [Dysgonamonadaceae bacterium]|jgi:CRISPR/Cas system-associated exonuclease Cas4 (RecB family)|nr:PD-(D/E)XK nuclease family protein [Dysgonamonadaceae bacterium]
MNPFLHQIAELFYAQYGDELYRCSFVFPNRRSGVFFQKYIAEVAGKPVFSPPILTISELFRSLSPYRLGDRIEMLVMLYEQYKRINPAPEPFDDFLFWGEMLLNDFSDVDKHLADAQQLFRNVQDLKSMDFDKGYLSEAQIEVIRRFWTNFMPVEGNETKKEFLELWRILLDLYNSFREELTRKGIAYEGMLFREVVNRAKAGELNAEVEEIVFVGFNALSPAETALMKYFSNLGIADFYWDYASPLTCDKHNKASLWAQENRKNFPSQFVLEEDAPSEKPVIEVIGIPSGVGQAKQAGRILTQLVESKAIAQPDEAINTAIVLPDENLLLPLLYSIPEEIGKINVTMGYGLSHASIDGLINHIADLQRNLRKSKGETVFYFRFALAVLNHPLIALAAQDDAAAMKKYIAENNRITVSESEINDYPSLSAFFRPIEDWREASEYLKTILTFVYSRIHDKKDEAEGDDEPRTEVHPMDLEREFIVQYHKTITRLEDTLREAPADLSVDTYFRLLKQLARSISVPFRGEPLSGLQVMGVLETRVLDFENLVLLSMNEGVFPLRRALNSFIPYSLRRAFGLPLNEHQDGIYAYHFYRMISRAKRVFMLYDTRAEEMQTGEVSRYFYQLKYLYGNHFDVREHVVSYDVSVPETPPVAVAKTPDVVGKLNAFRAGGSKYLSASLLNNYINCPLQFYFTAVENLNKEEDEVQESVEASVFGTIFHKLMEKLYGRYKHKTLTPDVINALIADDEGLTRLLEEAFAEYYFKRKHQPEALQGQYFLIGEILRDYVKQTLKADMQFTPFEYIGSEYKFGNEPGDSYRVDDKLTVNFKGSIDRIDKTGGCYRIIDYKTGTGSTDFKTIEQLFDASKNKRPYQILQVFVYSLFYGMKNPSAQLSPAIYYLRFIFDGKFNPSVTSNKVTVTDISPFMEEFTARFNACIGDIFNENLPFSQTENEKTCQWCAFKEVCGR